MLIPLSRSDQLALARNVMHKDALGSYGPGPQLPDGVFIRLLVPHYDQHTDKVRMFDVIGQGWIKDELRPCQALREIATEQQAPNLMPVDRIQPTQFWLDTLIWLYQARHSIVLGANELNEQCELLAAGLACSAQKALVFERFELSHGLPENADEMLGSPTRYAMRG